MEFVGVYRLLAPKLPGSLGCDTSHMARQGLQQKRQQALIVFLLIPSRVWWQQLYTYGLVLNKTNIGFSISDDTLRSTRQPQQSGQRWCSY